MANETTKNLEVPVWRSWPLLIGYSLTALFFVFWTTLAFLPPSPVEDCSTKFCIFLGSTPNEIGDTFAGLFGSFVFVWIIVTVLLQGLELRAQRSEIEASRKAQEAQAQSLAHQVSVLANQNVALQEQRHDQFIEALITTVKQFVDDLSGPLMTWKISFKDKEGNPTEKELMPFKTEAKEGRRFLRICTELMDARLSLALGGEWLDNPHEKGIFDILKKPLRTHIHRGLLESLERILKEKDNCSVQMKLKIQRMSILQFKREFAGLMNVSAYWNGDFEPSDPDDLSNTK